MLITHYKMIIPKKAYALNNILTLILIIGSPFGYYIIIIYLQNNT
jgi:hypothetical protein